MSKSNLDTEQGLLERVFKLKQHGTTARTELIAGITTFLTMVYIVFVNPQILGVAGMDVQAVFVTTCLIAAFGSIFMGLLANLPVALAPAMGLNAFFAFVVVGRWVFLGRSVWALFSGGNRFPFANHFPHSLLDDSEHPTEPACGDHKWYWPVYCHDGVEECRYRGRKPRYTGGGG